MTTSESDLAEFEDETSRFAHDRQLQRIHQAFCRMPFGGIANFAYPDRSRGAATLTLEQIAGNLDNLVDVLNGIVEQTDREREELGTYRRLVSAMREVAALFTTGSS